MPSDVFWALDIWELKSVWRPVGNALYVSFVFDPHVSPATSEADVSGVDLGTRLPAGACRNNDYEIGTEGRFAEKCTDLVQAADRLRDGRQSWPQARKCPATTPTHRLNKRFGSHSAVWGTKVVIIRVGSQAKKIMMSVGLIILLTGVLVTRAPR